MGTRSLTKVLDEEGKEILCLYRQFDGYPEGHGADLKEFLKGMKLTNGYSTDQKEDGGWANGMGCLAGQLVAWFKTAPEGKFIGKSGAYKQVPTHPKRGRIINSIYLYPPKTTDCGEEFIYEVSSVCHHKRPKKEIPNGRDAIINLKVIECYKGTTIYDGPADKFDIKKAQKKVDAL